MTMTIELSDEVFNRLKALSVEKGCSPECVAENLVLENLSSVPPVAAPKRPPMTDEELDAHLVARGVRLGNPQKLKELLESWQGIDRDPDSTVEEWDQLLQNVEEGGLQLRRVKV